MYKYIFSSIGFVALYFVYIMVVIGSRFIYVKNQKKKEKDKKTPETDLQKKINQSVGKFQYIFYCH